MQIRTSTGAADRRRSALAACVVLGSLILSPGCGGEVPDQRTSGTLVVPLDSVERAGEASGKMEDAAKSAGKSGTPKRP